MVSFHPMKMRASLLKIMGQSKTLTYKYKCDLYAIIGTFRVLILSRVYVATCAAQAEARFRKRYQDDIVIQS